MIPAIGYSICERDRMLLDDPAINGAEITCEQTSERRYHVGCLHDADFDYVSVRSRSLSVADIAWPDRNHLDALKTIANDNGARSVSDRLRPTRDRRRRRTRQPAETAAALAATCRNVDLIQDYFGETRFYFDGVIEGKSSRNVTTEAEFLSSVLRRTGCGWLLNVTGVYTAALNEGFDPYEFVEEVTPAAEALQMHLTGVCFDREAGRFAESQAHAIPKPVFDLYEFALEMADGKVAAVFIERDRQPADDENCRQAIQLIREIAESVAALG